MYTPQGNLLSLVESKQRSRTTVCISTWCMGGVQLQCVCESIFSGRGSYRVSVEIISGRGFSIETVEIISGCGPSIQCLWRL